MRLRNEQPDWKPPGDREGDSEEPNDRSNTLKTLLLCEAIAAIVIFILLQMVSRSVMALVFLHITGGSKREH